MIKRLKAMIVELFTPSIIETNTSANYAYKRCTGAISHCVLGAGVMSALVLVGVPAAMAAFMIMWAYIFKEAVDYFEAKDFVDCIVDWTVTATGVLLFSSPLLPLVALVIGAVIFFAYM